MEHTAFDRDPELGQENIIRNETKSQGHGWQNYSDLKEPLLPLLQPDPMGTTKGSDSIESTNGSGPIFIDKDGTIGTLPRNIAEMMGMDTDLFEKLSGGLPGYIREFIAEHDRLLSSLCLHQEERSAHHQIGSRMSYRYNQINALHFLFVGAMIIAYYAGCGDWRPRSALNYLLIAEVVVYVTLILIKILERYEHDKRKPEEFCFRLNFQNLPALREVAGKQKWKDMQECSDYIRVVEDLNDIVINHRHDLLLPSGAEVSEV